MKIIIIHLRDMSFLQRRIILNAAIVARVGAVIAPTATKKRRNDLQIMNYLANFAPSNG